MRALHNLFTVTLLALSLSSLSFDCVSKNISTYCGETLTHKSGGKTFHDFKQHDDIYNLILEEELYDLSVESHIPGNFFGNSFETKISTYLISSISLGGGSDSHISSRELYVIFNRLII